MDSPSSPESSSLPDPSGELHTAHRAWLVRAFARAWPVTMRSDAEIAARADAITQREERAAERIRGAIPDIRVERQTIAARVARSSRARIMTGAVFASAIALVLGVIARETFVPAAAIRAQGHTYVTSAQQRATVTLTDGSRVTLAPQTVLTVRSDFGRDARVVSLVGEAYFQVAQASRTPFVVRAGDVRAQVLGTAFTIRRYRNDSETIVAVASGKVAVTTANDSHVTDVRGTPRRPSVVLLAGMVGAMTDSGVTAISGSDLAPYTGWVDGRLVFRDALVPQALAVLGRWYGYEFRLADSTLATRHLTNTFDANADAEMLTALRAILDVDMTFRDHVVTLRSRRVPSHAAPSRGESQRPLNPQLDHEVGRE